MEDYRISEKTLRNHIQEIMDFIQTYRMGEVYQLIVEILTEY